MDAQTIKLSQGDLVMLVDDDPHFSQLLTSVLIQSGLKVLAARTIQSAKQHLEQNRPDLAVVDGLLPDGTGMDLIGYMREQPEGDSMRCVFMSAFFKDLKTYRHLRNVLKVVEVIHKPIGEAELKVSVARWCEQQPDANEDILKEIRADYARQLPTIVEEISLGIADARDAKMREDGIRLVRAIAHKVYGTAGSYGLHEISRIAGQLEAAAQQQSVDLEQIRSLGFLIEAEANRLQEQLR